MKRVRPKFICLKASDWQGGSWGQGLKTIEYPNAASKTTAGLKEPNDWFSYLLSFSGAGRYILWIRYKSIQGALTNFYFDNTPLSFAVKVLSTNGAYKWIGLGRESLRKVEKGVHALRIELLEGSLELDNFIFANDISFVPEGGKRYGDKSEKPNNAIAKIKHAISKHRRVKVATVQYAVCAAVGPQERTGMRRDEYRLAKIGAIIDEAAGRGADIVCLPECITSLGLRGKVKKGENWGEPEPIPGGWSVEYVRNKAKENKVYVMGFAWEKDGKDDYLTAYLVNRTGALTGKYRKVHPCGPWKPGDGFPVFKTEFGKIGMLICYDMQFPEAARILTLKGAEIIFYPLGGDTRGNNEWETMVRGRAIDNNVYIVASAFSEIASLIVDLDGTVIAKTDIRSNELGWAPDWDDYIIKHRDSLKGNGIVVAELDLDRIKSNWKTQNRRMHIIRSRQIETYGELINPSFRRKPSPPAKFDEDMYL